MTYDPNTPPTSRDRAHNVNSATTPPRSGPSGMMIALGVLAIVLIGAFFLWPDRTSNVAGTDPATTGTTSQPATPASPPASTLPPPAPAPAPSTPAPVAPDAPAQAPAPAAPQ